MGYQYLKKLKNQLLITSDFQDDSLEMNIELITEYMIDSGVAPNITYGEKAVSTVARGVDDLLKYGKRSSFFEDRVAQLSYKGEEDNVHTTKTI